MYMKKQCFSLILTGALLLSLALPVGAADMGGSPPPKPGEGGAGGGPAAAGQEFGTFEEVRSNAGILIEDETASEVPGFDGITLDAAEFITAQGISGMKLTGSELEGGVAIRMPGEADVFTIGGPDTYYEVDGRAYNTVISVSAGTGNDDLGYEAVHGVGVGIETGELRIENSLISSDGPRSTPIYAFSTQSPGATSVVAVNSRLVAHSDSIWMPPFKLLSGGARATLLMTRNNSWFYGTEVESNNWGAVSQDSVDAMTYMVNSSGISTEGGYGTYLTYGMRLYGSDLYAGQYGVFMCGSSDIVTDTGAAALENTDAMSKADFTVDTQRSSNVAAPFNAIVVHNSLPDISMVAQGVFKNSLISTDPADLPDSVTPMAYDDAFFMPGVDILGSGNGCGAAYFYNRNLYGSLALIRSMNADFTFDNATTRTTNGVLIHSVVTYDPPSASGYLTPEQSLTVPGIAATFQNGSYQGDILHQDYQRAMTVTVEADGELTGKAISGTYAGWNQLWSEENLTAALASDGYSPDVFENEDWVADVHTNLIRSEDTVYAGTDNAGISMTVEGTWYVTGDSSLKSLTIGENGQVSPLEGCEMTLYTGCSTDNDLVFYDESAATEVTELAPGTYENVVIRVTGTPLPVEDEAEDSLVESVPESTQEPADDPTLAPEPAPEEATQDEMAQEIPQSDFRMLPLVVLILVVLVAVILIVVKKKKH